MRHRALRWWYVLVYARVRVYHFYFPKKAFTPSHGVRFLLIFSGSDCEGLKNKVFTQAANTCEGLEE